MTPYPGHTLTHEQGLGVRPSPILPPSITFCMMCSDSLHRRVQGGRQNFTWLFGALCDEVQGPLMWHKTTGGDVY